MPTPGELAPATRSDLLAGPVASVWHSSRVVLLQGRARFAGGGGLGLEHRHGQERAGIV